MKDATVAIEDERFYQHKGVDFEGVVRAALKNASSGKTLQGGSTLTMQLIRTLYTGSREKTFKRKVREAKLAEELENVHSGRRGKAWILTKYLNSVPYGTNGGQTAVGVQAAARAYFNKPASQLTLRGVRAARRPAAGAQPVQPVPPGRAARRRAATRCCARWPTSASSAQAAARAAIREPLELHPNSYFREKRESYFFDYVSDELIKRYGVKTVRGGGLTIKTTIDLDLQHKARNAIAKDLELPRRAVVGDRDDRPVQRPHPHDGLVGEVPGLEVQHRRRRQAPARLDVQGHGARRGRREGHQPRRRRATRRAPCSSARSTAT